MKNAAITLSIIIVTALVVLSGVVLFNRNTPTISDTNSPTSQPSQQTDTKLIEACNAALAFMTFPDGAAADIFLLECTQGKHPEVVAQYHSQAEDSTNQAICTQDVKICPNGTAVGRSGQKCSFEACSYEARPTQNWKTITADHISIKIPPTWTSKSEEQNNALINQTTLSGTEGQLILATGIGFGGMCDNTWSKIKLMKEVLEGCYGVNDKGQAQYTQISKQLDILDEQQQYFDATVMINKSLKANANLIYTILSTLEVSSTRFFKQSN